MTKIFDFLEQVQELIRENAWEDQLLAELIENSERGFVRIKLAKNHPVAPGEIVNEYSVGVHSMEQVQQECLRAIRTGRPGI